MATVYQGPALLAFDDAVARRAASVLLSQTMPDLFALVYPLDWAVDPRAARVGVSLADGRTYAGAITWHQPGELVFQVDAPH